MFNKEVISTQAQFHDSFYLYDEEKIQASIAHLTKNFPSIKFLYSIKTNANPYVVKSILSSGMGVDAASVAEVLMGDEANVPRTMIQYSAPGKTESDIRQTIDKSTITADSLHEISLIQKVAQGTNQIARIGVRLNPDFSFVSQEGCSSKFGIDESIFFQHLPEILAMSHIQIIGLHIHIRSQELDSSLIAKYHANVLTLAQKLQAHIKTPLAFINMGSGIGIPYETTDTPVDIPSLGCLTEDMTKSYVQEFPDTQIYIETGRYLVGNNGVYVTKVLDKKVSHGKTYVVLNNTLNGFIRPCLAQLIAKYSNDISTASEPLYTTQNPTQFHVLNSSSEEETVDLVGNLCTASDVIASNITLPRLEIGDIVVCTNAGSYAAVLSPTQFSSQRPPEELFLAKNGMVLS